MTTEADAPDDTKALAVVERAALPTVRRDRLITEAPTAMFDSAAFEHMQRVATVIFRSGFVPETLAYLGTDDNKTALPEDVVVARCVLLADQAHRAGADVVGYIQATSLINGRLMHEGKLVNAILQRRLSVRLKYRFGLWDTDHIVLPELVTDEADPRFGEPVDPAFFHGAAERLALRAFNPAAPDEAVEGSVGQWKTTRSGSPWSKPADWPRQLRYRAVREWARAYDPGTVLGMIADGDEEIEQVIHTEPTGPGVMARLPGNQNGDGYDPGNGHATTEQAREGVKTKRAARRAAAALPAPEDASPQPETASASPADAGQDTSASASPASDASPEQTASGPAPTETPTNDGGADTQTEAEEVISEGYPEPGEVYFLNGDEWVYSAERDEDRRDTYKDGQPFSDAGRDKDYAIYEDHAPEGAAAPSNEAPEVITGDEEPPQQLPAEMKTYVELLESTTSFVEVKKAMQALFSSDFFKGLGRDKQNAIRSNTWDTMDERRAQIKDLPDHAQDVSAFRLWLEWVEDPNAIEGTLAVVQRSQSFTSVPEATQAAVVAAAKARIALLLE